MLDLISFWAVRRSEVSESSQDVLFVLHVLSLSFRCRAVFNPEEVFFVVRLGDRMSKALQQIRRCCDVLEGFTAGIPQDPSVDK